MGRAASSRASDKQYSEGDGHRLDGWKILSSSTTPTLPDRLQIEDGWNFDQPTHPSGTAKLMTLAVKELVMKIRKW